MNGFGEGGLDFSLILANFQANRQWASAFNKSIRLSLGFILAHPADFICTERVSSTAIVF
jgi:hypothetical protein